MRKFKIQTYWCCDCLGNFLGHPKRCQDLRIRCLKCRRRYTYNKTDKPRRGNYNRNKWFLRKYGVDLTWYQDTLCNQGGICAICKKQPKSGKTLVVDHCHRTGRVRELICQPCNMGLGGFGDDITVLMNAVEYLQRNGNAGA